MKTVGRRGFIKLCGCAACGAVLALAGCSNGQTTDVATGEATDGAGATGAVRCPRGITWDPYPGRCHSYRDTNGNRYCDWSEPA